MSPSEFERELQTARNPRKPAAYLLVCWVALADGKREARQLETAGKTIGAERVAAYSGLAEKRSQRCLKLACGIIAEAPPTAQLAVLIGGIRAAVANEELAVEENILLRFLGELTGHDMEQVFEEETGIGLPELPAGRELLAAVEVSPYRDSVHGLLSLIGKLRQDLSLPSGGWWDDELARRFGSVASLEKPREKQKEEPEENYGAEEEVDLVGPDGGNRGRGLILAGVGVAALAVGLALVFGPGNKADPQEGGARKEGSSPTGEEVVQPPPVAGGPAGETQNPAGAVEPSPPSTPEPTSPIAEPPSVSVEPPSVEQDDPERLVRSGTRSECEDYLQRNPQSLHYEAVEAQLVELEMAEVMEGEPEPIGQPLEVDPGFGEGEEVSIVEITNGAGTPRVVLYRGDHVYRLVVPPGQTKPLVIQNGIYTVAVTGEDASGALLGRHELMGGRYTLQLAGGGG